MLVIAQQLSTMDRVRIFQSEFFRSVVPAESLAFPRLTWIPAVRGDREASLLAMRQAMLASEPLRAGVFIGGMAGVEDEYAPLRRLQPGLPASAVASTGAPAAMILRGDTAQPADPALRHGLETDLVYGALFRALPGVG